MNIQALYICIIMLILVYNCDNINIRPPCPVPVESCGNSRAHASCPPQRLGQDSVWSSIYVVYTTLRDHRHPNIPKC